MKVNRERHGSPMILLLFIKRQIGIMRTFRIILMRKEKMDFDIFSLHCQRTFYHISVILSSLFSEKINAKIVKMMKKKLAFALKI